MIRFFELRIARENIFRVGFHVREPRRLLARVEIHEIRELSRLLGAREIARAAKLQIDSRRMSAPLSCVATA